MIKNIKTVNGILYLLYQTDIWKSKSSYVCFGVFDSFEHANEQAKKNDLYNNNSEVVIKPVKINQLLADILDFKQRRYVQPQIA